MRVHAYQVLYGLAVWTAAISQSVSFIFWFGLFYLRVGQRFYDFSHYDGIDEDRLWYRY